MAAPLYRQVNRSSEPGDRTQLFGLDSPRLLECVVRGCPSLSNMPPSKSDKWFAVSPQHAGTGLCWPRLWDSDFPKPFPAACNSLPVVVYFAIHSFIHTKHALTTCQVPNSSLMMVLE